LASALSEVHVNNRIRRCSSIVIALLILFGLVSSATTVSSAPVAADPLQDLINQTGGHVRITRDQRSGLVRFVGTDTDHAVPRSMGLESNARPEAAARGFLASYGTLFGLSEPAQELALMSGDSANGQSFVRFQQVYQNIPLFGGELIVQTDGQNNVLSAGGKVVPRHDLDTTPRISAANAGELARALAVKKYKLDADNFVVSTPELWLYNPTLFKPDVNITTLVWRVEVTTRDLEPIDELVLIDAQRGHVALSFNQTEESLYRIVYNANNTYSLPGTQVRIEGGGPTGDADADNAYSYAGDTYNYYFSLFARDSVNNAGLQLKSTVHYCPNGGPCPYANAFWNGQQMVYGTTYASARDVVGHELTHGVTQNTSHLYYYMQSGAINEAISDIFGELVEHTYSSADTQWLMGEDLPGGAIRSMSNPPLHNQPDKMTSTYYVCDPGSDQGGVHTNSGVANKTAWLMAIGGTFNGKTVVALGTNKTAHIWYFVETNLLTSASDYQYLYSALAQAARSLVGSYGITAADVQQVQNAIDATQMNFEPPGCSIPEAPLSCPVNQLMANLFFDDMENTASGNWASGAVSLSVNDWYYPQNPNPYTDMTYATSGHYNLWGNDIDVRGDYAIALTHNVALPAATTPYLYFRHAYDFEYSDYPYTPYDGAVVEYSTNGGVSWTDAVSLPADNGYDGTIYTGTGGDNPLKGRLAFTGMSFGYTSSRLNLASLAGQNVRFRFRIGTDTGNDPASPSGTRGWFIDDVRVYRCVAISSRLFLPLIKR
jgi:bacillolysin